MEIPNSVRYFQRLNEMVKELVKEVESEKKGKKMYKNPIEVKLSDHFSVLKAVEFDREQYEQGWNDRDNEIVRCKDCVYCKRFNDVWYLPKKDELLCTLHVDTYHTTKNDYCSWGERKDEVTE